MKKIKYEFSFSIDSLTDLNFEIRKFNPPFEIIEDFQMDTLMNKESKKDCKKVLFDKF